MASMGLQMRESSACRASENHLLRMIRRRTKSMADTVATSPVKGKATPPSIPRISFILSCFSQLVARGQLVVTVLRATRCESCGVVSGQDTPVSLYLGNPMCEKVPQIVDLWEKTGS